MQPTTVVAIVAMPSLSSARHDGRVPLVFRTRRGQLGEAGELSIGAEYARAEIRLVPSLLARRGAAHETGPRKREGTT